MWLLNLANETTNEDHLINVLFTRQICLLFILWHNIANDLDLHGKVGDIFPNWFRKCGEECLTGSSMTERCHFIIGVVVEIVSRIPMCHDDHRYLDPKIA